MGKNAGGAGRRGSSPDLWRLQAPGLVASGVAGEVLRDGLRADVLAVGEFRHRVRVEPEAAEVVREIPGAALRQPRHGRAPQAPVLALEAAVRSDARRVGKAWVSTCRLRGSQYHNKKKEK